MSDEQDAISEDLDGVETPELNGDEWIPDQPPLGEGPNPDVDHPEPTDPEPTPKSYGLDDIVITIQDGTKKTLGEWLNDPVEAITVSCADADDESIIFDFDDPTGHPRDVVVYTAGRPS